MALQPKVFSEEVHGAFYLMSGRRVTGTETVEVDGEEFEVYQTELILNEDGVWEYETNNDQAFREAFAESYDTYAKEGFLLGLNNNGGDYSFIVDALESIEAGTNGAPEFAEALAKYWNTVAVDSGYPAHGGTAWLSASNDALSKEPAFLAAITNSYTTDSKIPPFKEFIENVEDVVKTIIWTTIEKKSGGGTIASPETIT